jgi:enoyl-CoA hydratase
MTYELIITETHGAVGLITFNRPKALNALNAQVIAELNTALAGFDADAAVRSVVITGNEKAFAAGADLKEMKDLTKAEAFASDFLATWDLLGSINKPVIAAVAGYCLGGGFEYALACDFIIAADTAKFALPEVTLGIMPGVGGTQRLTKIIGKSKAMEMILTGRMIDVAEAEKLGIVARVIAADQLMTEAMATAEKIAGFSSPAIIATKRAVNEALESHLADGIKRERSIFYGRFDYEDQKEGMAAFLEKRKPVFSHK